MKLLVAVVGSLVDCLQPQKCEEQEKIELAKAELDGMKESMLDQLQPVATKDEDEIITKVDEIIQKLVEKLRIISDDVGAKPNKTENTKKFESKVEEIIQGLLHVLSPSNPQIHDERTFKLPNPPQQHLEEKIQKLQLQVDAVENLVNVRAQESMGVKQKMDKVRYVHRQMMAEKAELARQVISLTQQLRNRANVEEKLMANSRQLKCSQLEVLRVSKKNEELIR